MTIINFDDAIIDYQMLFYEIVMVFNTQTKMH